MTWTWRPGQAPGWVGRLAAAVAVGLWAYLALAQAPGPTLRIRSGGPVPARAAAEVVRVLEADGWRVDARTADGAVAIDARRPLLHPTSDQGLGDGGGIYLSSDDRALLRTYRWSTHQVGVLARMTREAGADVALELPGFLLETNGERSSPGGAAWRVPPAASEVPRPVAGRPSPPVPVGFGGRWGTLAAESRAVAPEHLAVAAGLLAAVALPGRSSLRRCASWLRT